MKIQAFFTIKQKTIANGNTVNSELEDGNDYCDSSSDDPSMPLLGQGKAEQTGVAEPCGWNHSSLLCPAHKHTHSL